MQPVSLALFWHQHQPYYPNDLTGENEFPWVRLHGTKDYWGMARHIQEVPEFRCTINLVPSLLVQLLKYTDGGGSDRHLDVSRMPADGLSKADTLYLLDHFFMANGDSMIRPSPRYHELFLKRRVETDSAESALSRFSVRDFRDLQVWSNLAWMHPILFEVDPELREFKHQGQSYSEADKAWLLDKQLEVLRICFVEPAGIELSVGHFGDEPLVVMLNEDSIDDGETALGQTFEFSVPLSVLGLKADSLVKFFVEAFSHGQSSDRVPRETTLEFTVPPPDFEHILWQV